MKWTERVEQFLHDPIDKCLKIQKHKDRAKEYAGLMGVTIKKIKPSPDQIASCMERSLLPKELQFPIQKFNEIRHPFSENKIAIGKIDKNNIFNSVKYAFTEIAKIESLDNEKKFLYLWRNLNDIICEKLTTQAFKRYISVLPADTRIPDHSIWEHIKITSAINTSNSLFLFTLGPVQSFISQARKAQDLFMASFLLSYLTFVAIEKLIAEYGPTAIIYPDLLLQPLMDLYLKNKINVKNPNVSYVHQPTIPNRFVAIIPLTNEDEIKKLAEDITNCVMGEWTTIVEAVSKKFELNLNNIKKQTEDFPEIYWVAIPFKKSNENVEVTDLKEFLEDKEINKWQSLWNFAKSKGAYSPNIGLLYQPLYASLKKSIDARKIWRGFKQIEEYGKKCHLCGEREGKIKANMGNLKVGKFITKTECLCVLCFTKRALGKYLEEKFGDIFKDFSFPSTAEVALTDFKEKAFLSKPEFKKYINAFKSVVGKEKFKEQVVNPLPKIKENFKDISNLEGEWFFEENLTKMRFKKQLDIEVSEAQIKGLKDKLKILTDKVDKCPQPYYAILMFDADNMGKWLSGELLPKIIHAYNSNTWEKISEEFKEGLEKFSPQKILTPAIHASISTALRNYSIEFVIKIVEEEHYGKLIYTGGDDLLAFVNLKDLFEVMRKLRAAFSGHIKFNKNGMIEVDWRKDDGFVEKDGRLILTMGKKATASCGVVIAHYKTPLKIVLDKVKELEYQAKEGKKDAFAIGLLKHSGEEKIGISQWRYGELDVLLKLIGLSQALKKGTDKPWISKGFIYTLDKEFQRLKDEKGCFAEDIFNVELNRLLERASHGKDKEKKKMVEETFAYLKEIFWQRGANIDNFVHLLEITAFITQVEEEDVY